MTALGRSGLRVSRLALGSWRTYERISRDQGIRVMQAAREAGVNFLDDARYNDETGHAPMPTGYSEIVFGELFRAAGWRRDEVIVSNKLWWEFWPDQSPAQELAASLGRMGLDHIDLIYSEVPPDGVGLEDAIDMITGLIQAGTARAWGTLNWTPDQMERAWQIADRAGVPGPVATQPPYSLVRREFVDDPAMRRLSCNAPTIGECLCVPVKLVRVLAPPLHLGIARGGSANPVTSEPVDQVAALIGIGHLAKNALSEPVELPTPRRRDPLLAALPGVLIQRHAMLGDCTGTLRDRRVDRSPLAQPSKLLCSVDQGLARR